MNASILPIKSSTSKSPRSAIILMVATLAITFTIGVFNFSNLGFKEILKLQYEIEQYPNLQFY